jgi:hypothetical protein
MVVLTEMARRVLSHFVANPLFQSLGAGNDLWNQAFSCDFVSHIGADGFLIMREVPYVNRQRQVKTGTLISSLAMAGDMTRPPDTHVVYCDGDYPCKADGTPIQAISHQSAKIDLGKGLTAQHTFSSKPAEGYRDYHQKMSTYAAILSGPATTLKSAAPQLLGHQRRVVSHTLTLPF